MPVVSKLSHDLAQISTKKNQIAKYGTLLWNRVACGRPVRFWKGYGMSVFDVFDGELEGRSPS